jgi:predicted helicase
LWGTREAKYAQLSADDVETTPWQALAPQSPFYLFVPQNTDLLGEYQRGWKVTDVFPVNVLGFQTHRDHFAVDFDEVQLRQRIADLRNRNATDEELRAHYFLEDSESWRLSTARRQLRDDEGWENQFIRCLYRSFDWRACYFSTVTVDRPRRELLEHVAGKENLCLGVGRQGLAVNAPEWGLVSVSREPIDANIFRRGGINVAPLYLYPAAGNVGTAQNALLNTAPWPPDARGRVPNLNPQFVAEVEARLGMQFAPSQTIEVPETSMVLPAVFTPEDLFGYIYAIFHAPAYRARYAEFLKMDFPRVPITSDPAIFRQLAALGRELVALHLLDADAAPALRKPITRYPVAGDNTVEKGHPRYDEAHRRVTISADNVKTGKQGQYIADVPPEVWDFQVGGYQPCQKWLKDRAGRQLTYDDLTHYSRIIVSLKETLRLMGEIDAAIPAWPIT